MPRRKTTQKTENQESKDDPNGPSEHICRVCGDKASEHIHYGSTVCYSCRAFFRRIAVKGTEPTVCNKISFEVGQCPMTKKMRHLCPFCRFTKCLKEGMKTSWVMTKDEKDEMREKAAIKRLTGIASDVLPPTSYEERRKYVRNGRKNKEASSSPEAQSPSTESVSSPTHSNSVSSPISVPQQNDLDTIELPPESVEFTDIAQEMYLNSQKCPQANPEQATYVTIDASDIESLAIETIQLSPSAIDLDSLDLNLYLDEDGKVVTNKKHQQNQWQPSKVELEHRFPSSKSNKKVLSDPVEDIYQAMHKTISKHPLLETYQREFEKISQSEKKVSKEFFGNLHTLVLQRMMTFIHNIKSFNLLPMHDQFRLINNNAQLAVHFILGVLFDPRLDAPNQVDFLKNMQFKFPLFTTSTHQVCQPLKVKLHQVAKYLNPSLLDIFSTLHTLHMDNGTMILFLSYIFFSTPKLGLREPGAILTIQLKLKKLLRLHLVDTHRDVHSLMPSYEKIKSDLFELTKTKNSKPLK